MNFGNVALAPNQELILEAIRAGAYEGFADIPAAEYFAAPYYSQSFLQKMKQSPAHAMADRLNPREATPALQFGTWCHTAVLEPELFKRDFIVGPDVARNTKEWKAVVQENPGKTILKPDDHERISKMALAVAQHPEARRLLSGGRAEVSMFAVDPETGVRIKGRMDYLQAQRNIISDYKTAEDASFEAFQRSIATYGYHWQTAFYTDLYSLVSRVPADNVLFAHIVGEKGDPYPAAVYTLDPPSIEKGRLEFREKLRICAECDRTGVWPAYPTEIMNTALPAWSW